MDKSLEIIRMYNDNNLRHKVAVPNKVIVIGHYRKNKEGEIDKDNIKFDLRSVPSKDAIAAGVQPGQRYIRALYKRHDETETVEHEGQAFEMFTGSKRPQAGNIFANTQSELYDYVMKKLNAKEYEFVGEQDDRVNGKIVKRPKVVLNTLVAGARVSVTVPKHHPQTRDASGARRNLTATTWNPDKQKYERDQAVVVNTMNFFADIDDIENLEAIAARLYERTVLPYQVEKVTIKTETGTTTKVEKQEPELTNPEELTQEQIDDMDWATLTQVAGEKEVDITMFEEDDIESAKEYLKEELNAA